MQADALVRTRQRGGLAHEVARHREGRAGGECDPQHGVARGVVVLRDQPLAVAQDVCLLFHQLVGRQATLALADAHAAATRVKPHADVAQRADLVVQRAVVGEKVEVVARRGATREHQLGRRHLRADIDVLGGEPRPDRVERLQPLEQVAVLRGRHDARERLVEMMVSVDQPRQHGVPAAQVQHLVRRGGQRRRRADLLDDVVADKDRRITDFRPRSVHRDQRMDVFDEQRRHAGVTNR